MFTIVVSICLLLLLALSGANLFVSNINPDELSNMGVERKSWSTTSIYPSPTRLILRRAFLLNRKASQYFRKLFNSHEIVASSGGPKHRLLQAEDNPLHPSWIRCRYIWQTRLYLQPLASSNLSCPIQIGKDWLLWPKRCNFIWALLIEVFFVEI